jgi:hypothetical protein
MDHLVLWTEYNITKKGGMCIKESISHFKQVINCTFLGKADTRAGTPVDLGLAMSTLITAVKNCEVIERTYIQYGTSSNQQKLLKYLLLEGLQSA